MHASFKAIARHFIVHPVKISYSAPMSYFVKTALSLLLILFSGGILYAQSVQPPLLSDLDIPLMKGFEEQDGSRVVFDTPEGRIIEAQATGPHGAAQVVDYYKVVLPSLSWARISQEQGSKKTDNCEAPELFCITAQRDGEILTLKIRLHTTIEE